MKSQEKRRRPTIHAERSKKTAASTANKSWTLRHRTPPDGVSLDVVKSRMAVKGLAHNAVTTVQFSEEPFGELALTECIDALEETAGATDGGDLRGAEALLTAQAVALNAIFNNLALRARANMGEHLNAAERFLRLALKAQGQCRATLETLATIKNPTTVFARQANIAHGPQQVNNGVPFARAGNSESEQNRLLEAHAERLDFGAATKAITRDSPLVPVEAINGTANG